LLSEVWSSADAGKTWALEVAQAPWPGRHCAGWLVHDGGDGERLYVVGGDANPPVGYDTDVWCSENGRDWTCMTERVPWSPRAGFLHISFGGYLWVMGGQTKGDPDTTVGFAAGRDPSSTSSGSNDGVAAEARRKAAVELSTKNEGPQVGFGRIVALHHATTVHPLHTIFTQRFGTSMSEVMMWPNATKGRLGGSLQRRLALTQWRELGVRAGGRALGAARMGWRQRGAPRVRPHWRFRNRDT
jgi:hypothetical protein